MMKEIGVGVISTGFMGKARPIAYSASASVLAQGSGRGEIVCDLSPIVPPSVPPISVSAATSDWREVVWSAVG